MRSCQSEGMITAGIRSVARKAAIIHGRATRPTHSASDTAARMQNTIPQASMRSRALASSRPPSGVIVMVAS
ncbi:hypothetical protein D3C83_207780 [compost metagenome]